MPSESLCLSLNNKASMTLSSMSSPNSKDVSKCKTMRRSRYGCRNCKLRKLKCDENKPQCKKCSSFGVLCNLMLNVPDLQPITSNSLRPPITRRKIVLQRPLASAVWSSDASTSLQLNAKSQNFIDRYLGQGLITPGDLSMAQVNRKLLVLAFTHPYLMHASLAVALAYDRYLNSPKDSRRTPEECYHCYQSTSLFNKRLKEPIKAKDRDPIWGTAAALALVTFANPDSYAPEESWPVRTSQSSDMDWLRISKGKMSLWDMANPLRHDSIFCILAPTYAQMHSALPDRGIDGVLGDLVLVCGLRESSTAENNPYFLAAHAVSRIQKLSDSEVTIGHTEPFMQSIHGPFNALLQGKDPVALLLLYLWYSKAGAGVWWIKARARVECPSICLYLQLYHKGHDAIHAILQGKGT